MSFLDTIRLAKSYLREQGRVSLSALMLEFDLDDARLEALIEELVDVQQIAAREGKILSWIGVAEATAPEPPTRAAPAAEPAAPAAARQSSEAERRQLTVMFCDIVRSTVLSEHLDAEALAEVVAAYQKICTASVESFDGHIAQYLGDGVLVYFGHPLAHEDDAMRAIHAALRILEEVPGLTARLAKEHAAFRERPLEVRVGIHTGPVVVGGLGEGETRERLALGDTVNIAARIEGEAEAASIVVSAATRHLVRGAFVFESLGERSLKGIAEPMALFRPLQATGVQSRLALAAASELTPLIGREREVGILLECWEQAKTGHGQVVLLSGDAGMGKSRMIEVLREHVANEPHTWHEYRSSAYHQNSAFHPVIEFVERVLLFTENDTPEERVDKLTRSIHVSGFPTERILPLIAEFLGLPIPEDLPALGLGPEEQRKRTMEALSLWPVALAQQQPLIIIAEDLHWSDPSSVELTGMEIAQVPTAPILFVATFRPEFEPPWPSSSRLLHLPLRPLTPKQIEEMATHLVGGKQLPSKVREQIAAKTDGVPLFVEELTKDVLESGLVVESDERYERTDPLPSLAIPASLRDSLTARLDRLGPAKAVAQLASVLGREFSYDLLRTVSPLQPAPLDQALEALVDAGLLYQRGLPPRASYIFKHALIQEAAQQSLLKKRRREYNALAGRALEEHFPARAASEPEVLARHYEEGGLTAEAVSCYRRAGERATQRSENVEAISHLSKALELLLSLPEDAERDQQEMVLQVLLGTPLAVHQGWASPGAERAYLRALELSDRVDVEVAPLARALNGLHAVHNTRGELAAASEVAERLLRLASSEGEVSLLVMGHHMIGTSAYLRGRLRESLEHWDQAIEIHDPSKPSRYLSSDGMDAGTSSWIWSAFAVWQAGYPDRALQRSREAIDLARSDAHPPTLALAVAYNAIVHLMRRERDAATERAEEVIGMSERQGFPVQLVLGKVVRVWARSDRISSQSETDGALASLDEVLGGFGTLTTRAGAPQTLGVVAEVCRALGRQRDALMYLDGGLSLSVDTGQHYWDAELQRLKGEVLLEEGDASEQEVERLFRLAVELAQNQAARALELRAATSLARLSQRQENSGKARSLLEPIYGWFSEGFDTRDLKDAKALLDELM